MLRSALSEGGFARRAIRQLLLVAAITAMLAHLLVGGTQSLTRVWWMSKRNDGCSSSQTCWRERNLMRFDLVELVNRTVPPNDQVVVEIQRNELAYELSFYCFPRPVHSLPPGMVVERPVTGEARLFEMEPGRWFVDIGR